MLDGGVNALSDLQTTTNNRRKTLFSSFSGILGTETDLNPPYWALPPQGSVAYHPPPRHTDTAISADIAGRLAGAAG